MKDKKKYKKNTTEKLTKIKLNYSTKHFFFSLLNKKFREKNLLTFFPFFL